MIKETQQTEWIINSELIVDKSFDYLSGFYKELLSSESCKIFNKNNYSEIESKLRLISSTEDILIDSLDDYRENPNSILLSPFNKPVNSQIKEIGLIHPADIPDLKGLFNNIKKNNFSVILSSVFPDELTYEIDDESLRLYADKFHYFPSTNSESRLCFKAFGEKNLILYQKNVSDVLKFNDFPNLLNYIPEDNKNLIIDYDSLFQSDIHTECNQLTIITENILLSTFFIEQAHAGNVAVNLIHRNLSPVRSFFLNGVDCDYYKKTNYSDSIRSKFKRILQPSRADTSKKTEIFTSKAQVLQLKAIVSDHNNDSELSNIEELNLLMNINQTYSKAKSKFDLFSIGKCLQDSFIQNFQLNNSNHWLDHKYSASILLSSFSNPKLSEQRDKLINVLATYPGALSVISSQAIASKQSILYESAFEKENALDILEHTKQLIQLDLENEINREWSTYLLFLHNIYSKDFASAFQIYKDKVDSLNVNFHINFIWHFWLFQQNDIFLESIDQLLPKIQNSENKIQNSLHLVASIMLTLARKQEVATGLLNNAKSSRKKPIKLPAEIAHATTNPYMLVAMANLLFGNQQDVAKQILNDSRNKDSQYYTFAVKQYERVEQQVLSGLPTQETINFHDLDMFYISK